VRCCGHMHTGGLRVFCRFSAIFCRRDRKNTYVYLTVTICFNPCGFRTGPIGVNRPEGQQGPVRAPVRAPQTHTGTYTGSAGAPHDCIRALYGTNIVGSPCLKNVHAQLSATGYTRPVRARTVCRTITHGFSGFWPLRGPLTARELHVTGALSRGGDYMLV
jgi:hypothetical protein